MFKSIPMSEDSVRRIRQLAKTQTSRVIVPQPIYHTSYGPNIRWEWKSKFYSEKEMLAKAKYQAGDLIWVREPLMKIVQPRGDHPNVRARYAAGKEFVVSSQCSEILKEGAGYVKWRWQRDRLPSIFMPREAARMFLRVEKSEIADLHRMNYYNIVAEGFPDGSYEDFITTWNKLNAKRGFRWVKGQFPPPLWIWRYTFRWENTFEFLFWLVAELIRRTKLDEKAVEVAIGVIRKQFPDFDEKQALQHLLEMFKDLDEPPQWSSFLNRIISLKGKS